MNRSLSYSRVVDSLQAPSIQLHRLWYRQCCTPSSKPTERKMRESECGVGRWRILPRLDPDSLVIVLRKTGGTTALGVAR